MRFSLEENPLDRKILGFKTRLVVKRIRSSAIDGVQLIKDARMLESNYGLPNSFTF